MKALRLLGSAGLVALLAFAISACQKKDQTESMMSDTTQVSQGYGSETPPDQAAPPAEPGAQGATLPPISSKPSTKPRSGSMGSSNAPKTPATYAEERTVEVPAGTMFEVEMITPVDTRTSNVGDRVEAKLGAPITHNGVVIAEAGAIVTGEVAEVTRASRSKSKDARASLALDFNSIQTVDGPKPLHATVANAEGKLIAKSTSTRDKLIIGGSTIAGAVIGKVAGKDTKATIIGAVGGAAVGTGAVLMAKGHELSIEEGAKVSLRVDRPIVIVER
jgi:hypothetical protein